MAGDPTRLDIAREPRNSPSGNGWQILGTSPRMTPRPVSNVPS